MTHTLDALAASRKSQAMTLLTLVWENCGKRSWQSINYAMRDALTLAIRSGMRFSAGDFARCEKFRWGYWVGSDREWIYTEAVVNENESCIKAWEEYTGRTPFRANGVRSGPRWSYLHTGSIFRARERMAVCFSFAYMGTQWVVTGFDDQAGTVRAALYKRGSSKPKKLKAFTHKEIKELFPAPKKRPSNPAAGKSE